MKNRREPLGASAMPRVKVRPILLSDESEFINLATQSLDFHKRWIVAPKTPSEFRNYFSRLEGDDAAGFVICGGRTDSIVGFINLNTIVGEPYCRGLLGYGIFVPHARSGFMRMGLSEMVRRSFHELSLHRLEADIQPENHASMQLVQQLGFTKECVSEGFIKINGKWVDHERWILINRGAE